MQDKCDCRIIHHDVVAEAEKEQLNDETINGLAQFYKAFGDATRLRIINAISEREMCVCDLASMLSVSESAVSHQLRLLRTLKLVKNRRDGNVLYYSLFDDHCRQILKIGIEHLKE